VRTKAYVDVFTHVALIRFTSQVTLAAGFFSSLRPQLCEDEELYIDQRKFTGSGLEMGFCETC